MKSYEQWISDLNQDKKMLSAEVSRLEKRVAQLVDTNEFLNHKVSCLDMERGSQEKIITSLQTKAAALADALLSAQRLLRENQNAIRKNLTVGYERIDATKVMAGIRAAIATYKEEPR